MKEKPSAHNAFKNRKDLEKYQENALMLFALQLRFQIEDIDTVASSAITGRAGKGNDKKCDLVYVDLDEGYAVIAQGYIAEDESKKEAKANKASDLNAAASWLLTRPIDDLPKNLRSAAKELRNAIKQKNVRYLQFWYVHNLPESLNVERELQTVERTAKAALESYFPDLGVTEVSAIEVGRNTLDEWYQSLTIPILVPDKLEVTVPGGYSLQDRDWNAFVTAVPAHWLYELFLKYKSDLFSANVRGYLGSRKAEANINNGIKSTVSEDPSHFWVYNNGLTLLVNSIDKYDSNSRKLEITGISIVNGAQTTGAIGSLEKSPSFDAMVSARFVECRNPETIKNIIKYNNSQNRVEAPDFRSNDPIQKRLVSEFNQIPAATYLGGRRGGAEDIIKRPPHLIPSATAAQALAAFHQDPIIAYNQKSNIWHSNTFYTRYFSERTTAKHIVFAYTLLRAIEAKKRELATAESVEEITEAQRRQLDFLNYRGGVFLMVTAVAFCLETFLGKPIPDHFKASFDFKVSPDEAQKLWRPIIDLTIPFSDALIPAVENGMNSKEKALQCVKTFQNLVESTRFVNVPIFQSFAKYVSLN